MYENMTFETIMDRALNRVSNSYDKREGSIIYNALAPMAAELTQVYMLLDWFLNQIFADTSEREYLILRANERGLYPNEATNAILKGVFNIDVNIGERFTLNNLYYEVIEIIDKNEHTYKLRCETAGIIGNSQFGTLIPVQYINNLKVAELTDLLIPGSDDEETEAFRKRYKESFDTKAFGGNRADYIQKVNSINGVGGCKLKRAIYGAGTVGILIIDNTFNTPSQSLIDLVQTKIDPTKDQEGYGLAPINHIVYIKGVEKFLININTTLTLDEDIIFDDIKSYVEEAVEKYLLELRTKWQDSSNLIVRLSQIESRILNVKGVLDINNTTLNNNANNIVVSENYIPILGGVINNG